MRDISHEQNVHNLGDINFCICVYCVFLYLCSCVFLYLRGMCHKLCLLMLTGKPPVSSGSSVSLARSVPGVILPSPNILRNMIWRNMISTLLLVCNSSLIIGICFNHLCPTFDSAVLSLSRRVIRKIFYSRF